MFDIKAELKKLPNQSGVYIMHDQEDAILYVGKAVNLKNRVSQYFQKSAKSPRIEKMISKICRFEYIVTDNEVEALILECNLIKKYRPPYNVMLKDDKTYPYIKVTLKEQFPRVFMTRSYVNDGSKYYGPYTDVTAVHKMLDFVKDLFPLKMCRKEFKEISKENRPCLNYHIKKCLAPCRGEVSVVEYREMIRKVCDFLDGKIEDIIKQLTEEMREASENLEYEKAGSIRDKIFALKKISEKQTMNNLSKDDIDVIGINKIGDTANIEVFTVRSGKLVGREKYSFQEVSDVEEAEIVESFMKQFYSTRFYIPKSILIRNELSDQENIEKWLSEKRGSAVTILVPKRGEKNRLLEMAEKNAHESFKAESKEVNPSQLLAKLIGIPEIMKIEAYDISNIGNEDIVGGMVTFVDNKPAKNLYRKFRIKTVAMQDDISCTYEVVSRRLHNADSKDEAFSVLPDLILADGGSGQVSAILRAVDEAGYAIPVVGMVKNSKHQTKALLVNGKNIALAHYSEIFKFIYEIQEEVHRVAIGYHRLLRSKKLKASRLDDIEGIGEVRKAELLKKFGDLEKIKEASVEELCEIAGITEEIARRLKEEL
ncbi:MAG: excinuclease ABC subunit UvrC [Clostridia bacterium]|nr:excinuclease ABC subunit UvrC [Clostridia bacterium]